MHLAICGKILHIQYMARKTHRFPKSVNKLANGILVILVRHFPHKYFHFYRRLTKIESSHNIIYIIHHNCYEINSPVSI